MAKRTWRDSFYDPRASAWIAWVVPVSLIILWEVVAQARLAPSRVVPPPSQVLKAFLRMAQSGEIWTHLGVSFRRAGLGFFIGGSVGLLLGVLNGVSRVFEVLLDSPLQMVRTVPHLALLPIVILCLGIGEESKVFLVSLGAVFPVYINTFHGIRAIDPGLLELARVHQLKRSQIIFDIIIPGALPNILVGVRYALGITWLTLIVAETVAASSGIGFLATSAREVLATDVIVLCIALYALLGKGSDSLTRLLERVLLRWHQSQVPAKRGFEAL